ncbi:MAG: tRNA (guanosine(37)-N1)-methyltransferase TrmD [bacterium]|nr:tRNA (guanosine(37)-N1)-methyltransferase TrmD [bacterium]
MQFAIVTLFPDYFSLSLQQSLLGKARDKGLFDIEIVNPREFAQDKHHTVDDTPFGGGGGMVMKVEPIDLALQKLGYRHRAQGEPPSEKDRIILTSAAGHQFNQEMAIRYSLCDRITIICGHYLGVDERLLELYEMDEVSIGDYILTGGEPAAAVMVDSVARLIPKVLGNFESALNDSYMNDMLGSPCYTRPAEYAGIGVPEILQQGNHEAIRKYRRMEAIKKCLRHRPELLAGAGLDNAELKMVEQLKKEIKNRE